MPLRDASDKPDLMKGVEDERHRIEAIRAAESRFAKQAGDRTEESLDVKDARLSDAYADRADTVPSRTDTVNSEVHWDDERVAKAATQLRGVQAFRTENWRGLKDDPYRRKAELRGACDVLVDVFGWGAPPIEFRKLEENGDGVTLGQFNDDDWFLQINEDVLQNDDPRIALETLCHEYRHAFVEGQIQADNKNFHFFDIPREELEEWKQTGSSYKTPKDGFEAYWDQAKERDARAFADRIVTRVYSVNGD